MISWYFRTTKSQFGDYYRINVGFLRLGFNIKIKLIFTARKNRFSRRDMPDALNFCYLIRNINRGKSLR